MQQKLPIWQKSRACPSDEKLFLDKRSIYTRVTRVTAAGANRYTDDSSQLTDRAFADNYQNICVFCTPAE